MNIETRITTDTTNIAEAARTAMDGAPTYRDGAKRLLAMTRDDAELKAALMGPYEMSAAMDAVTLASRAYRKTIWTAPSRAERSEQAEQTFVLAESNLEMLDFPLPGGKPLRLASKADVKAAAYFYSTQATDMAYKGRWLVKIAGKMKFGQTVGEALDNEALKKMQKDARNG